ncbi:MAG: serine hydrolase domain-containing protein, partial [Bacteriovoracaceae bacterium]
MKQLLFLILFTFSLNGYGLDYKEITKKYIDENQSKLIAPGSVVALVKDGRVEHFQTIGKRDVENSLPVERETVFRIGSLTKTFTATAIVQLREKGLLKLDDLVEDTIHELRALAYPYPDSPKITIRHLLTHSSGLIRHPMPLDQSVNGLIKELLNPALGTSFVEDGSGMSWYPGYAYLYSNVGITLLGEVVTRISGMDVSDYIKQEILAPLGMDNTYWHESEVPS